LIVVPAFMHASLAESRIAPLQGPAAKRNTATSIRGEVSRAFLLPCGTPSVPGLAG